jgi:hypothetical protein
MPTPTYDREWAMMPQEFVDEILMTIPRGRSRRRYRRVRDETLGAYGPTGFGPAITDALGPSEHNGPYQLPDGTILVQPRTHAGAAAMVNSSDAPTAGWMAIGMGDMAPPPRRAQPPRRPGPRGRYRRRLNRFGNQMQFTLAHELGHILGLAHSDDPTSVMMQNNQDVILPSADDVASLMGPDVGLPDPGDPGYSTPPARRRRRRG